MILIDYSQVVIAGAFQFQRELNRGTTDDKFNLLRHSFLSSLLAYKRDYGAQYGEIIIAMDGQSYWRKDQFPHYKALRAKAREESSMDWEAVHQFKRKMEQELREFYPYRVIRVNGAEADDVIAVLTKEASENGTQEGSFFGEAENVLIISSDGDFKQLHRYANVRQWNPLMKKFVSKPEKDFLINKIIDGDRGDGIPSVLMADESIVEGIRAKPLTAKVRERLLQGDMNEIEKRNFSRNKLLIDFECIPDSVAQEILGEYRKEKPARDLQKIMSHLSAHRCRQLLENLQEF